MKIGLSCSVNIEMFYTWYGQKANVYYTIHGGTAPYQVELFERRKIHYQDYAEICQNKNTTSHTDKENSIGNGLELSYEYLAKVENDERFPTGWVHIYEETEWRVVVTDAVGDSYSTNWFKYGSKDNPVKEVSEKE